jgi:DNA-binding transcriptional ArsR family regulator
MAALTRSPSADQLLDALSDPTRRRVVQLLGERPHRAGELARAVGASAPVMSRHLRTLSQAGFVDDERGPDDARQRIFRLRGESMAALQAWLDQLQADWKLQLGSFARHIEQTRGNDGVGTDKETRS